MRIGNENFYKFSKNYKFKDKWSIEFDSCQNCKTNLTPHEAQGLCKKCYRKLIERPTYYSFYKERLNKNSQLNYWKKRNKRVYNHLLRTFKETNFNL